MRKTSRKLIPALAMLVIAAVALTSASYAWFTMSRTVQAKGMSLTAIAPTNLLIANAIDGNYDESATVTANFGDSKLMPSSSMDGTTVRWATTQLKSANAGAPDADTTWQDVKTTPITDAQDGYYADYHFWLKTTGEDSVSVTISQLAALTNIKDIYAQATITADTFDAAKAKNNLYTFTADESGADMMGATAGTAALVSGETAFDAGATYAVKNPISEAVRFAILKNDGSVWGAGVKNVYAFDADYFDNITGPISLATNPKDTPDAYKGAADANLTDGTDIFTVAGGGTPTEIVVRVWIEGQDSECVSDNADATFTMNVGFSDVNYTAGWQN